MKSKLGIMRTALENAGLKSNRKDIEEIQVPENSRPTTTKTHRLYLVEFEIPEDAEVATRVVRDDFRNMLVKLHIVTLHFENFYLEIYINYSGRTSYYRGEILPGDTINGIACLKHKKTRSEREFTTVHIEMRPEKTKRKLKIIGGMIPDEKHPPRGFLKLKQDPNRHKPFGAKVYILEL